MMHTLGLLARLLRLTRPGDPIETGRSRMILAGVAITAIFAVIGGRLVDTAVFPQAAEVQTHRTASGSATQRRADIVDRNGVLLATSLPTVSASANPRQIRDAATVARQIAEVLPHLNQSHLQARLSADSGFVYIDRHITPQQHYLVNRLGIPGVYFHEEFRRVYPQGRTAAHVVGLTDIDTNGLAGVEHYFDDVLFSLKQPLRLSVDVRLQHIVRQELAAAIEYFDALGGAGVLLDVDSGEVLTLVSLPDFDPNDPTTLAGEAAFNRVTKGVYETGSVFKLFTAAMALEKGVATMATTYDATAPIRFARHSISDFRPENRWLSLPEVMVHSSNIGSARMAIDAGTAAQQTFLEQFGFLDRASIELPEVGHPLVPRPWREINTMTIAFGHGLSITPIQLVNGVAALANGGTLRPATVLKRLESEPPPGRRVLSERTSEQMRWLMRLVVDHGTGRNAEVPAYPVGGKTGTADKAGVGGYRKRAVISSFVGAFPIDAPRYVVLVMVDEPQGRRETFGYATGGWVAAPAIKRIVERAGPLLGLAPLAPTDPRRNGHVLEASARYIAIRNR